MDDPPIIKHQGGFITYTPERRKTHKWEHRGEIVNGVQFVATLEYDENGELMRKMLTRADLVRG